MAVNNAELNIIDYQIIRGMILIGAGLLFGIGIRVASIGGFLPPLLYFLNPSNIGVKFNNITTEGSYFIEMLVLIVILFYPLQKQPGLYLLLGHFIQKKSNQPEVNTEPVGKNTPKSESRYVFYSYY